MASTEPATEAVAVDFDLPYLGWFDHYQFGWQAAIVYQRNGERVAYRLGEPLPFERATEMCRVLASVTGVQVAGELSKRGFLPVSMGAP
ncbi:hypothetical protein [Nonomuraea sp. NPDC048901]|uniref:hypothetical protein n=1 Tax=Nonomuraea sp. NPDC048901 TaxID=3155627 RepID=UPI0034078865